jgi:hypothetical protein
LIKKKKIATVSEKLNAFAFKEHSGGF